MFIQYKIKSSKYIYIYIKKKLSLVDRLKNETNFPIKKSKNSNLASNNIINIKIIYTIIS